MLASAAGQGIRRTAALLRTLGRSPHGMRLTEVAAASGLSKSTVHRLLAALTRVGLVEQDELTSNFHLSFEFFSLGATAANRYGLVELAHKHLVRIEERCHDTVFLSVRAGNEAICVHRIEGRFPIKVLTLAVGDRRPLGVGAGSLALLAFLPDHEISALLKASAREIRKFPGLNARLIGTLVRETRRNQYSFNAGRIIPDMCAIGVPVLGPDRRPVAAISIAAIAARMKPARRAQLLRHLREGARELEAAIAELTAGLSPVGLRQLAQIDGGRTVLGYAD